MTTSPVDIETWPLGGLTIQMEDLRLSLPEPAEMSQLARDVGAEAYHPWAPFLAGADTSSARQRRMMQAYWAAMGGWKPAGWSLILAASAAGRPVGLLNLRAEDFAVRGEVEMGYWVRAADQGAGFGTRIAAGGLHLAFEGLGASFAVCEIDVANEASRRVAEKVGYEPDGMARMVVDGRLVERQRYRLSSSRRRQLRSERVAVTGLAACRDMFG